MISFCTADKIEAASFSGSAERQTVKRRHAAIASRLQAVIRSVELIVQPDAHDVAVEACRGLHVVDEKGHRTATVHHQLAVEGHTAQIIVQIFDLADQCGSSIHSKPPPAVQPGRVCEMPELDPILAGANPALFVWVMSSSAAATAKFRTVCLSCPVGIMRCDFIDHAPKSSTVNGNSPIPNRLANH